MLGLLVPAVLRQIKLLPNSGRCLKNIGYRMVPAFYLRFWRGVVGEPPHLLQVAIELAQEQHWVQPAIGRCQLSSLGRREHKP